MKNFCNFNARFRKSAALVANEMGMEFISTPRQVENGTLMFNDPVCNVKYAMYESGYVRRLTPLGRCPWGNAQTINEQGHAMYQLNQVIKAERSYISPITNKSVTYEVNQRVLASPNEQLAIMVKAVVNYRLKNA